MLQVRLGKHPPKKDERTLRLGNYLKVDELPPIPDSYDSGDPPDGWPMFKNDELGDCTCAAAGHMIESWSNLAGKPTCPSVDAVVALYDEVNGGVDEGAPCLDVLNCWRQAGLGGDKILAFVEIDASNLDHVKQGLYLFGGLYTGFSLPNSCQQQTADGNVWSPVPGPDGEYGSWGGHCVNIIRYDAGGLHCVTWGQRQAMTWDFWRAFCDEVYAIIPSEFASGHDGLDVTQLKKDLRAVGK